MRMTWGSMLFNSHQQRWQNHGSRSIMVSNFKSTNVIDLSTYFFWRLSQTKRRSLLDPVYFGQPSWWAWIKFVSELHSRRKYPEIPSWAPLQCTNVNLYGTEHPWDPIRYRSSPGRIDCVFDCLLSVYILSFIQDGWLWMDEIHGVGVGVHS